MEMTPIWKDTEITAEVSKFLLYRIELDGETIFNGKAYILPGAEEVRVNINKLCQDYLSIDFPDLASVPTSGGTHFTAETAFRTFEVYDNETDELLESIPFIYNWSYRTLDTLQHHQDWLQLSIPINGKWCPGMYYFQTYYEGGSTDLVQTWVTRDHNNIDDIDLNPMYTTAGCGKYALYYLNSIGGWDSFLIEGNVVRTDTYSKHNINRAYSNTTLDFEEQTYISEIDWSYVLNTGWLTDTQSENLADNLLSSNKVYMHNLETDRIAPVVITNTEVEHKRFHNGNQMVQYAITVNESQKKYKK